MLIRHEWAIEHLVPGRTSSNHFPLAMDPNHWVVTDHAYRMQVLVYFWARKDNPIEDGGRTGETIDGVAGHGQDVPGRFSGKKCQYETLWIQPPRGVWTSTWGKLCLGRDG